MEADNLVVKQIHIWIEIQLVYDGLTIILPPVFEFTRIRCDLLVWDSGFESTAEEIVHYDTDRSLVGAVSAAPMRKGAYLKFEFLYNPLHCFTIDLVSEIAQLCPKTPIPVIFVLLTNGKDDLLPLVRHFRLRKFLLPVHIGRFRKICDGKDVFQLKFSSEAADDPCLLLCIFSCRRSLLSSFK